MLPSLSAQDDEILPFIVTHGWPGSIIEQLEKKGAGVSVCEPFRGAWRVDLIYAPLSPSD